MVHISHQIQFKLIFTENMSEVETTATPPFYKKYWDDTIRPLKLMNKRQVRVSHEHFILIPIDFTSFFSHYLFLSHSLITSLFD